MKTDNLIVNFDKLNQSKCERYMVKWIKMADHTLEIAFFFVLHRTIVRALAKRCREGVRCRLVLYRRWLVGAKRTKYEKYVKFLMRSGVQIRWVAEDTGPATYFRMFIIDHPADMEETGINVAYVLGDQRVYVKPYNIISDFKNLQILNNPDNEPPWGSKFEALWGSKNALVPGVFPTPKRSFWLF